MSRELMLGKSMLELLMTKEAAVKAIADSTKNREKPVVVRSALERIRVQKSQISLVNGGDPLTGEGITK